ncbi:SDR family oxidoreductase [bacterium]|nr:SDR family oxidoreductase [bacterium]
MNDKYVLITGSSSGIGYEITSKLLDLGAKVIGIARNHDRSKLKNKNYVAYNCDVSVHKKLEMLLKQILKIHPEINCLISNAGYGNFGPLENFSTIQIDNFIATNLTSHLIITKSILPHFKRRKVGDIIFIGSEAGLLGTKNGSLYCAVKFGLKGFAQALSKDISYKNIRVSIINPGMVRTDFFENLNFEPGNDEGNAISLNDISSTVSYILNLSRNTVVNEINLSPSKKVIKFK